MRQPRTSFLDAIFESSIDGIIAIDGEGRILLYNPAAERIFGYAAGEVTGRDVSCLMPSPDRELHHRYIRNYLETGEARIIGIGREVRGQRKDGSTFPMELAVGEANIDGERCFVGVIRDISGRKRAETALRREHDFITSVLDTVGAIVVVLDSSGRIVLFNRACEQMTGYQAEEMVGRPVWDVLLLPEELPALRKVFGELTAGHFPNHYRNAWLTRAGERRIIDWTNTALLDEKGHVANVVATGIDVTERIESERRLQELQSELAHVSRLSEIGQMTSILAHEVNQPLTAISSYLQAARRLLAAGEPATLARTAEIIDNALGQVGRMMEIVGRLSGFVKKSDREWRAQNIATLIEEASALALIGAGERGIRVQRQAPGGLPEVLANKLEIQQVVVNLVRNAIEAMEGSERRELTLATRLADPETVTVSVIDTGPGVPEEMAERLFQPFTTTKAQGMGLGLSICRTIIERHGGKIWAERNPAGGSIFAFTLPTVG